MYIYAAIAERKTDFHFHGNILIVAFLVTPIVLDFLSRLISRLISVLLVNSPTSFSGMGKKKGSKIYKWNCAY
jgi:hypothetical protein